MKNKNNSGDYPAVHIKVDLGAILVKIVHSLLSFMRRTNNGRLCFVLGYILLKSTLFLACLLYLFIMNNSNCGICNNSWNGREPRVLPCEERHIFCTKCLEDLMKKFRLGKGDNLICPICGTKHLVTKMEEKEFLQLSPFKNFLKKMENVPLKFREFLNNYNSRLSSISHFLDETEDNQIVNLEKEIFKFKIFIDSEKERLVKELKEFKSQKQFIVNDIQEKLKSYEKKKSYELSISDMENIIYDLECKFNKIDNCCIQLKSLPNLGILHLGQLIYENKGLVTPILSISRVFTFKGIFQDSYANNKGYYFLTKDLTDDFSYIFNFYKIDDQNSFSFLCDWKKRKNISYKLSIKSHALLLEMNSEGTIYRINESENQAKLTSVDNMNCPIGNWKSVWCFDKANILFKASSMEIYVNPVQSVRFAKINLPFETDILDVKYKKPYIFILTEDSNVFMVDLLKYPISFESIPYLEIETKKDRNDESCNITDVDIARKIAEGYILLSNKENIILLNSEKKIGKLMKLEQVFPDCQKLEYYSSLQEIRLYIVTSLNKIIVRCFHKFVD